MASSLLQALVPLFFVLALGYVAGRFHSFDADQATGFNTLLVEFAFTVSPFVIATAATVPAMGLVSVAVVKAWAATAMFA